MLRFWPFDTSLQAQKNSAKVLALMTIAAGVHTIRSRTVNDFLSDALPIAGTLIVVVLIGVIKLYRSEEGARQPANKGGSTLAAIGYMLLAVLVLVPTLSVAFYVLGVSLKDLFVWARAFGTEASFGPGRVRMVVALLSLGLGAGLYAIRKHFRTCYGVTEIVVGVLVALVKTSESPPDFNTTVVASHVTSTFAVAILTASVYLVVRGFDNAAEGLKGRKDPLAGAVLDWLRRHRYLH